uniref:Uncharacterized protein n=1 Tax=Romanomermis culicivorax TaxID=13658 RepID=A0A915IKN6_ROMCU
MPSDLRFRTLNHSEETCRIDNGSDIFAVVSKLHNINSKIPTDAQFSAFWNRRLKFIPKMPSRKLIKKQWKKLADRTSIHGVYEIYYAKSTFWTYAWIFIVGGSFLVTSYQMYQAVLQYWDQASLTDILPVKQGQALYPPVSLCYQHWIYWVDWAKVSRLGFTKAAALYGLSYINTVISSNFFDIDQAKQDFKTTMKKKNMQTISQFYTSVAIDRPLYETLLTEEERKSVNFTSFRKLEILFKKNQDCLCYTAEGATVQQYATYLTEKSLKISMMGNKGEIGSSNLDCNYHQSTDPSAFRTRFENKQTKYTSIRYSFTDPDYKAVIKGITEEEYNFYIASWLMKKSRYWMAETSDYFKDYSKFTMPVLLYVDSFDIEFIEMVAANAFFKVSMSPSVHRWKSTSSFPCLENEREIITDRTCLERCKARIAIKTISCPDMYEAILLDLDRMDQICSYGIYFLESLKNLSQSLDDVGSKANLGKLDPSYQPVTPSYTDEGDRVREELTDKDWQSYSDCVSQCKQACEQWRYTMKTSTSTLTQGLRKSVTKNRTDFVIIYPPEQSVLIMVEVDAQSWEDFVANVGGLLGVWTGASIISFIQLIYLLLLEYLDCNKRQNQPPSSQQSSVRVVKCCRYL